MEQLGVAVVGKQKVASHLKFVASHVEHCCCELVAIESFLCNFLYLISLFSAETVSVRTKVLVVERECAQCLVVAWENILETLFPVAPVVLLLHVPAVVCNTIERDL